MTPTPADPRRSDRRGPPRPLRVALALLLSLGIVAQTIAPIVQARPVAPDDPTFGGASEWRTWVLSSSSELRLPPPPDRAATQEEIMQLRELAGQRDSAALAKIAYWNAGSPSHRWNEMLIQYSLKSNHGVPVAARSLALLHVAIYDAMAAAWDTKYTYSRPRPADLGPALSTALPTPRTPAYPSEHAVAAGAASSVLAYLFPNDAMAFAAKAEEAGQSRLIAGVDYPSDVEAGLELGRSVAARVIERAKGDGSDVKWDGQMPTGPGYWTGANPSGPTVGQWRTWALTSGSELRPAPPPAYDSPQKLAELAELNKVERTPKMTADAYFWEYGAGGLRAYAFYNDITSRKIVEYGLADEPLSAARAFALQSIALYDAAVACWEGKFYYWAARPFQLDPALKALFPAPNHPSYPAAHGCVSGAAGAALTYLFPLEAETYTSLANQAGEARIWAGIHFRSDVDAGLALGRAVAAKVIERARVDARG